MGKTTIAMAIFNSKLLVYQRITTPVWFTATIKIQSNRDKPPFQPAVVMGQALNLWSLKLEV